MALKHEELKNKINRGSTEKAQDAILMTSSHRQKCLWPGLFLKKILRTVRHRISIRDVYATFKTVVISVKPSIPSPPRSLF